MRIPFAQGYAEKKSGGRLAEARRTASSTPARAGGPPCADVKAGGDIVLAANCAGAARKETYGDGKVVEANEERTGGAVAGVGRADPSRRGYLPEFMRR